MTMPGVADEITKEADRLGLKWSLRPGTVQTAASSTAQNVLVTLDGDTEPVPAFTLIGPVPAGARVMCLRVEPEGIYIIGTYGASTGPAINGVRVTLSNLLFGSGAVGLLTWGSESYDTNAYWSISDPQDINITVPGIYTATVYSLWSATATGFRFQSIALNGATMAAARETLVAGDVKEMNVTMPDTQCAVGDVINFPAFQNSGVALTVISAIASVRRVGSI